MLLKDEEWGRWSDTEISRRAGVGKTFVGKMRRRGQNEGYRHDWKKAYVKLAEGEKMIEYAENV